MNRPAIDQIVHALLYEGYILYPYRASAKKNRRERFTFGRVYPRAYSVCQQGAEPFLTQTECLVEALGPAPALHVQARFLHPLWREPGALLEQTSSSAREAAHAGTRQAEPATEPSFQVVPELRINGKIYQTWQEAVERSIEVPPIPLLPLAASRNWERFPFGFPDSRALETVRDREGRVAGVILRRQEALEGVIEFRAEPVDARVFKVAVRILNETPVPPAGLHDPDSVLMRTLASTHTILHAQDGRFLSSLDPPSPYQLAVATCKNIGAWPVLVGDAARGDRDTMLSSPIILYDYPAIAPQSPGDFFDGAEIDEMLALRVQTLTPEEKREMREVDGYARQLLERTESLPQEQWGNLHGSMKQAPSFDQEIFGANPRIGGVAVGGAYLRAGDRVRIRPRARADVIDLALQGKTAVIEAVEQDAEGRIHLAVVLPDDPGQDLGRMRLTGHRFFYAPDEIEPLREGA